MNEEHENTQNLKMNLEKNLIHVRQEIIGSEEDDKAIEDDDEDDEEKINERGTYMSREEQSKQKDRRKNMDLKDAKKRRKKICKNVNAGRLRGFPSFKSRSETECDKLEGHRQFLSMRLPSENNNNNNNNKNKQQKQKKSPSIWKKLKSTHAANEENERHRRRSIQAKNEKSALMHLPFTQHAQNQQNDNKNNKKQQQGFSFRGGDRNSNNKGNKGKSVEVGLASFIGGGVNNKQGVKQSARRRVPPKK